MGVIKQGILGGVSGKVGSVVGTSWKGIAVLKAMPLSVANPKTAAQTTNRDSFSMAVACAKDVLSSTIKPLLDRTAVKQSGYNSFVQMNKVCFTNAGLITPAALKISKGNLAGGSELAGSVQVAQHQGTVVWSDNTGEGNANANDVFHGMVYNQTKKKAVSIPATAARSVETKVFPIPADWLDTDDIYFYGAFRKLDGTLSSDTAYYALP